MFAEILKTILIGIVQGITEWLPVSSTGHMLLLNELISLNVNADFWNMFLVVIQLGSIFAVIALFWNRLFPFGRKSTPALRSSAYRLWLKVIIGIIPVGIVGVIADHFGIDEMLDIPAVVAGTLIFYGIVFIIVERLHKGKTPRVLTVDDITYTDALKIGAFQILSIVPGTSRSGSTIIGASIIGVGREAAAEFSFFLACPVMLGASLLKLLKFGFAFSLSEAVILLVGMLTAFIVSMIAIKFLMSFVKKHSFEAFGWYRIALGALVAIWLLVR